MKKAVEIVQEQLEYYNQHDLEGFVSVYADHVKIYHLIDQTIMMEGKEELRERYKERFEVLKVHAELENRIVIGNKVIDHECVSGLIAEGVIKAVAIYETADDLIQNVWFLYE